MRLQGFNCYLDNPKSRYLIICNFEKVLPYSVGPTLIYLSRDASASKIRAQKILILFPQIVYIGSNQSVAYKTQPGKMYRQNTKCRVQFEVRETIL